ncbi:HAD family hydrolase [Marinicrinis sediminis]|uniref:HAD family hydrolase n=1 Tax=Marinicrinis sediminis TaxID=1652465 RepID=A0ABW5R5D9_9BACL
MFDLDNTLLNYSKTEFSSMERTVHQAGLSAASTFEWDLFWYTYSQKNKHIWEDRHQSGYAIEQILEQSFFQTLGELDLDASLSHSLAKIYWDIFCHTCELEEDVNELLSSLYGTYKLAIITNGISEGQRKRLAAGQIDHFFNAIIVSDEVGCCKPDKLIFGIAMDKLQVTPSDVLFVGDSIRDDYAGAMNAELDFCLINRKQIRLPQQIQPTYFIHSLKELLHVL